MSFRSAPGLHPPDVSVSPDPDRESGDIFLTPRNSYQGGAMILNSQGRLVWFHHINAWTTNLEVQRYLGRPVLTWWQDRTPTAGPEDVVMSTSYRVVAVIHQTRSYSPDLHEFQITPEGTALIDSIHKFTGNLTRYGGPSHGTVWNDSVEELNIRTGRVLWRWHSLGHVPISDSYATGEILGGDDYFHINSIQQLANRDLLISSRNTWAIYLISRRTGRIIWTLGGKHSSFHIGAGADFSWQHDARLSGHTLTLFDDACCESGRSQTGPSSGLTLHLDTRTMSATLVHRYSHNPAITSDFEGSMQTLPDGNVFVGWGIDPEFSEFSPDGRQLFTGRLPVSVSSYRAYRFPWVGRPRTRPALALERPNSGLGVQLYMSWNGATQVAAWRVLAGRKPNDLTRVVIRARRGFETEIRLRRSRPYFAVQALSSSGQVLGTSATHRYRS